MGNDKIHSSSLKLPAATHSAKLSPKLSAREQWRDAKFRAKRLLLAKRIRRCRANRKSERLGRGDKADPEDELDVLANRKTGEAFGLAGFCFSG
jgi:hypothetical protein